MKNFMQEDVLRNLMENTGTVAEFEEEFEVMKTDRDILRQIFPTGESRVSEIVFDTGVKKSIEYKFKEI